MDKNDAGYNNLKEIWNLNHNFCEKNRMLDLIDYKGRSCYNPKLDIYDGKVTIKIMNSSNKERKLYQFCLISLVFSHLFVNSYTQKAMRRKQKSFPMPSSTTIETRTPPPDGVIS